METLEEHIDAVLPQLEQISSENERYRDFLEVSFFSSVTERIKMAHGDTREEKRD